MARLSKEEIDALLAEPHIGVLSTVDAGGQPEGSPVWFEHCGGSVLVLVHRDSKKARNLRTNPKVSLTVDTRSVPYRGVILRGTASVGGPDPELRRRIAHRYLGSEIGDSYLAETVGLDEEDALLRIEVTSSYSWDYSKGL